MSESSDNDPLRRVVVDKDELDREWLSNAMDGIIAVDRDTGEPIPRPGYYDLDNKSKFVARLLARRAALALNFIDKAELGDSSSGFADRMPLSASTIMNYGSLKFVKNDDEHGGYYVPSHSIGAAIEFLEAEHNSGEE